MERMEEIVVDTNYEALQQFISSSPWDERKVFNRVALEADKLIGGTGQTGLLIDETCFAKKGKMSVGVSRQWNGRLGKTENSQVAVFGALSAGERAILVDTEFFLSEPWISDFERCRRAGVPLERCVHKTKVDLAWEIVERQRELGVRFDYVCTDGLYGNSGPFVRRLDDEGIIFVVHVHSDQLVYLEDPQPFVPPRKSCRGSAPTKLQAQTEPIRVDNLLSQLEEKDFERIMVRETTKANLEVDAYRRDVWVWDNEEESARKWTLYIRKDVASPEQIKYCLTNATPDTPTLTIARMESQRFWIERSFEDAKSQVGMAQYQVRGWMAWHHHMALVMMAMLFMTKHRMLHKDDVPLLSCYDIKVMLAHFLPEKAETIEDIIRQMEVRHKKRRAATASARKRRQVQAALAASP
jgi:SRSO17 transposase